MSVVKKAYLTVVAILCLSLVGTIYVSSRELTISNKSYSELVKNFIQSDISTLTETINTQSSGYYYLSKEECPYCQESTPVLEAVARYYDIQIHYIDFTDIERDSQEYKSLQSVLKSELYNDGLIYVPMLIRIENGTITGSHIGTIDGNDGSQLTEGEKEELLHIYKTILEVE